jgi:hypothetical protein
MNSRSISVSESRTTAMTDKAWQQTIKIIDGLVNIMKAILMVAGVLALNLADFIMGSIGISLVTNTALLTQYSISGFGFGSIVSLAMGAIQIFLWSVIQRRGITLSMLMSPKKLPKDVRSFISVAMVMWFLDTLLDVSPLALMFTSNMYAQGGTTGMIVYKGVIIAVTIMVGVICGGAEILTTNMKGMLFSSSGGDRYPSRPAQNKNVPSMPNMPMNPTNRNAPQRPYTPKPVMKKKGKSGGGNMNVSRWLDEHEV